jgi:hypothetical protein
VKIPWIVYVGAGSHALPLLVAAARRPTLGLARKWVLIWCGFLITMSGLSLFLALQGLNNHWLHYVVTPIAAGLVLWALAWWQLTPLARLTVRLLIPLVAIAWVPIVLTIEHTQTFSLLAEPFAGLVILAAAIYTLAARALREHGNVVSQDWFWVATGVAFYCGAVVALPPASYWLLDRHPQMVVRAYQVKALVEVLAFLAIAWGVTRQSSAVGTDGWWAFGRGRPPGGPRSRPGPLPRTWD